MELLHEGKAKRVYQDDASIDNVIIDFTDNVTAGDGEKHDIIQGKGKIACDLSDFLLRFIASKSVDTHYIKRVDDTRLLCKKVDIIPLEVVCRNITAGSFCKRYGVEKGRALNAPFVEFFLKDDSLHDPLIAMDAALSLGLATREEMEFMKSVALSVNYYLSELFKQINLVLVDFKLEFGKTAKGTILLADEISGDTIRVWNEKGESYDKDLYRRGEGDITIAYSFLLEQLVKAKQDEIKQRDEILHAIVMPKDGIKNPPGEVTKKALARLGFSTPSTIRVGKIFEIHLNQPITTEILNQLALMNIKLLSNPIAEKHQVRLDM